MSLNYTEETETHSAELILKGKDQRAVTTALCEVIFLHWKLFWITPEPQSHELYKKVKNYFCLFFLSCFSSQEVEAKKELHSFHQQEGQSYTFLLR